MMQRRLCAAILFLEAIMLGLTTPVLISVNKVDPALAMWIGLGLCVACLVVASTLRFRISYALGWLIQLFALALGFKVGVMLLLGGIFLALWATAYFMGAKIEREVAERERLAAGNE